MSLPPLVHYGTALEYRAHYERVYCRGKILTFDGIRVYFSPGTFDHAFYESTNRDGNKDKFSSARAERIDWIKATLEHPNADIYAGWNKMARCYDPTRRVAVVFEKFVVVIALRIKQDSVLKANFVTGYQADNSIGSIRSSPIWSRLDCLRALGSTI
jgi:hypothetical protein